MDDAQQKLDRFLETTGDERRREGTTVGEIARSERLIALPATPYPATISVARQVGPSALVAYQKNRYSLPPGLEGSEVEVRHRLGEATLEIVAKSGACVARHMATPGAGALVRHEGHRDALEQVVLSAFTTKRPCKRKANRPPGEGARAAAAALRADGVFGQEVVVDLADWARAAGGIS